MDTAVSLHKLRAITRFDIVPGCIGIVQTVNSQPFDYAQGTAVNNHLTM